MIAPREGLSDEVLWRIEGEKREEGGGEIVWKDRVWIAEEDEPGLGGKSSFPFERVGGGEGKERRSC